MPLYLFHAMVQKSQKWPKTQIKGSCLKRTNFKTKKYFSAFSGKGGYHSNVQSSCMFLKNTFQEFSCKSSSEVDVLLQQWIPSVLRKTLFDFIKSCGSQISLKFSEVALLCLLYSPK